ncbi:MAG: hypothetical protein WBE45_16940 [Terriglobales bacterium]
MRDITIAQSGRQNYLVIDPPIWAHANAGLSDLRLLADDEQVPYSLSEEQASSSTQVREARILNLGLRAGRTEFDLDLGNDAEYNQVQLRIKATNFVAAATADGRDVVTVAGRKLSTSTLYDFSRESLGNNFALRVPLSTFRYLHVSITPAIAPNDVTGASTSVHRETQAKWVSSGQCHAPEQVEPNTKIACDLDPGAPVGRILFTIPPDLVNFRRTVNIVDPQGVSLCVGSISRIKMKNGTHEVVTEVATEDLALSFCNVKARSVVLEIENADNKPLLIEKAEPQSLERRIYFDPAARSAIKLYYGDEMLTAPEYDYARFFQKQPDEVEAVLSPERANPYYTGRPDARPWSEQHKWVLWTAMLLAMAVLAILALKGFTSGTAAQK